MTNSKIIGSTRAVPSPSPAPWSILGSLSSSLTVCASRQTNHSGPLTHSQTTAAAAPAATLHPSPRRNGTLVSTMEAQNQESQNGSPADNATILSKLLETVHVSPTALSASDPAARPSRGRLVLEHTYDLNNSATKVLRIGMDTTRDMTVGVMLEGQTRLGIQLAADTFTYHVYESDVVKKVSANMANPTGFNGALPTSVRDECELSCISLADGKPAVRLRINDKAYSIIGACTWYKLQKMKPLVIHVISMLRKLRASPDLQNCIVKSIRELCKVAQEKNIVQFDSEYGASRFVIDHFQNANSSMLEEVDPLCLKLLLDFVYNQTDIFARMFMQIVNENMLE
ncbi:Eukaryotic peptide chain release factor subunit 1 [Frankliniella fusca]|uniref:Eukaryotic peptide chain release factor subunit 1 n=1 Tax=Frankliniella fusca TaxID=407009 RepID=A0AAE1HJ84_9NEOP|nr:Eukaryotic peptide chain release factor subunit 1 [Frankliniella fusca]